MQLERKQDLSIYYWLKDLFSAAPFITIKDGFPDVALSIPTVAVESDSIYTKPFELGNRARLKYREFYIDVFAADKSQRDEYAYKIINELEDNIPVYNYDEGFPESVTPTQIGALEVDSITMRVVRILPELTEKMYYRSVVQFSAVYNEH